MDRSDVQNSVSNSPNRILVVEDDGTVRHFCVRLLRLNGYHVDAAENGREALERLQEHHYDLVLTDLQMPLMSGMVLLQTLRQQYPDIDAIVFTAHATVETARAALKMGAFDYLTKPVSVDDLERTVRRAIEWRNIRLEKQRLSEIVALYEFSQTFTSTLDTDTAVQEIIRLLSRRFSPSTLSLSLLHQEDNQLELLAHTGSPTPGSSLGRITLNGQYDQDAILKAHHALTGEKTEVQHSHLVIQVLRTHDRPVGILQLSRSNDQPAFDPDDRTLLAICASQIAASLDNSRLYRQLKEQNIETIAALAAAIDARDPYTHGHSKQVMLYAVRLAEVSGLTPKQIERVRYGALLHDIGKIGIRDYILLKPNHLTDEEAAIMQTHPLIGADILGNIKALRDVIPIVECHHERLDGYGYPKQLSGEQICVEARIIAIVDAYDAMTSHRAYRKAMQPHEAFAVLRKGSGDHWDATFVQAFIDLITREGHTLLLERQRPQQLTVTGLLERPILAPTDARD